MNLVDLVKQALIIGAMLGAIKFLLTRFGGSTGSTVAGYLG